MKTTMKRFLAIFLAFCMIFAFSSSVIVSAIDEIADSNTVEYYIELWLCQSNISKNTR